MSKNKYFILSLAFWFALFCINPAKSWSQTPTDETRMCKLKQTASNQWLMGIPDSLLNRDLLFGARAISLTSADKSISAGQMRYNPSVVRLEEDDNGIVFKTINTSDIAPDGTLLREALKRNTRDAVVLLLPVVEKQAGMRWINISAIFDKPFPLVFPIASKAKAPVIEKLSKLYDAKVYIKNLELKAIYYYDSPEEPFTAEIQYSFVCLPQSPMRKRISDDRVGYNSEKKRIYAEKETVESVQYISRWDIQPRPQDVEAHKKGGIVEPAKPIVVHIDSALPRDWHKYVKQGIEDWNLAFATIGFKDVIRTRDFTPEMDPQDSRYICFRYLPLDQANANGALWNDPRSGEIVQGDILFWQNVTDLLQTWRFVQTAAVDPKARVTELDDETMGQMIRYSVAHEMGHVLGLQHNMRGSYAYPVDSLRSPSFTQQYGTTASIMDYARFNYVAQPGDLEKGVALLPPVLGSFDYLSIKYGYQIYYDAANEKEEKKYLDKLFEDVGYDPMYLFSPLTISMIPPDPASQSDAIGNDLVYGAQLGIKNVQIITNNLADWTVGIDKNPLRMVKMNNAVRKHYFRLLNLTISNIGGIHSYPMVDNKILKPLEYISKETQRETIFYILSELRNTHNVLETKNIKSYLGEQSLEIITGQKELLDKLFSNTIINRLLEQEISNPNGYKLSELITDTSTSIFVSKKNKLSTYEEFLQLYYVNKLKQIVDRFDITKEKQEPVDMLASSCAQQELTKLRQKLSKIKDPHTEMLVAAIDNSNKKAKTE